MEEMPWLNACFFKTKFKKIRILRIYRSNHFSAANSKRSGSRASIAAITSPRQIESALSIRFINQAHTHEPNMTGSSKNAVSYGQVVVGPPGAGKTTYCQLYVTIFACYFLAATQCVGDEYGSGERSGRSL
jgi:hypothetical protein